MHISDARGGSFIAQGRDREIQRGGKVNRSGSVVSQPFLVRAL